MTFFLRYNIKCIEKSRTCYMLEIVYFVVISLFCVLDRNARVDFLKAFQNSLKLSTLKFLNIHSKYFESEFVLLCYHSICI